MTIDIVKFWQRAAEAAAWSTARLACSTLNVKGSVRQWSANEPHELQLFSDLLKTPELKPFDGDTIEVADANALYNTIGVNYGPDYDENRRRSLQWAQSVVEEIASRRAALRGVRPSGCPSPDAEIRSGRLLCFYSNYSLDDEGSAGETAYLLDDYDAPPWDIWIAHVGGDTPGRYYEGWSPGGYYSNENITYSWKTCPADYLVSWIPGELEEVVEMGTRCSMGGSLVWLDELESPFTAQLRADGLLGPFRERINY